MDKDGSRGEIRRRWRFIERGGEGLSTLWKDSISGKFLFCHVHETALTGTLQHSLFHCRSFVNSLQEDVMTLKQ